MFVELTTSSELLSSDVVWLLVSSFTSSSILRAFAPLVMIELFWLENVSSAASEQSFETDKSNSSPSNGLENFDFDEETPELFNSNGSINETEEETSLSTETSTTRDEEDDLEIPAFLRRQKN